MLQNGLRLHSVQQVAQARLANSRHAPRHALLLPFAKLTRVTPSQGPKMQPLNDQEGQNSVAFTLLDSFTCKQGKCAKAASRHRSNATGTTSLSSRLTIIIYRTCTDTLLYRPVDGRADGERRLMCRPMSSSTVARRWPHRNVPLALVSTLVFQTRMALNLVVDAYVLLLPAPFGSNQFVGIMEGICGWAQVAAGVIAGFVADRAGRAMVMRFISLLSVLNTMITAVAVLYVYQHGSTLAVYACLCCAALITGLNTGSYMVSLEAIFGDSTTQSGRRKWYVYKQMCGTAGMALGPLVAVVCFLITHNTWTYPELTTVILAGCTVGMCNAVLTLFFVDVNRPSSHRRADRRLPHTSGFPTAHSSALLLDGQNEEASEEHSQASRINSTLAVIPAVPAEPLPPPVSESSAAEAGADAASSPLGADAASSPPKRLHVAVLITASNVCLGLGSGTLYKFIPLFCLSDLKLSPIAVHAIVAAMQGCATLLGLVVQCVSKRLGSIFTALLCMACSVGGLAVVCIPSSYALPLPAVIGAILVRGAFMNSVGGLTGSVLNDHVSDANRAKWSTATMVSRSCWSGSALLGGWMVDRLGYRTSFLLPLGMHVLSMICLLPLLATLRIGTSASRPTT